MIYISIATAWELAIKCGLGKLSLPLPSDAFIRELNRRCEWQILSVGIQHIADVQVLPSHHRDSFDRMLVAQAVCENLQIVSVDTAFDSYGLSRVR